MAIQRIRTVTAIITGAGHRVRVLINLKEARERQMILLASPRLISLSQDPLGWGSEENSGAGDFFFFSSKQLKWTWKK